MIPISEKIASLLQIKKGSYKKRSCEMFTFVAGKVGSKVQILVMVKGILPVSIQYVVKEVG